MRIPIACLVALALGVEVRAQTFDLERALALPPTPGSVALLVEHTKDERARARLVEALHGSDAEVRAAAARVVFAAGHEELGPELLSALALEEDSSAAAEMVRAIAGLEIPESDTALLDAARRLDLVLVAGPALAAARGLRVFSYLDALRVHDRDWSLTPLLRIASRDDIATLVPYVEEAIQKEDAGFWGAYLEAARGTETEVEVSQLTASMVKPALRPATLWHLLTTGTAIDVPLETTTDVEEGFLLELLERRKGEKPREDKAWISRRVAREPTKFTEIGEPRSNSLLLLLTKNERRALSSQIRNDPKVLDELYERAKKAEGVADIPGRPSPARAKLRTVSGFPPGFVASVLAATGCKPGSLIGVANAEVRFSLSGRPLRSAFPATGIEPNCAAASRALILNSIVSSNALSAKSSWDSLLVVLEPGSLACLAERAEAPFSAKAIGKPDLKPPRKVQDFGPVYPPSARVDKVSGLVVLEATITSRGCVSGLQTLQSPDDRLALASIIAVSRWQYEPTRLEGVPVPILMMVSVNFTIN